MCVCVWRTRGGSGVSNEGVTKRTRHLEDTQMKKNVAAAARGLGVSHRALRVSKAVKQIHSTHSHTHPTAVMRLPWARFCVAD